MLPVGLIRTHDGHSHGHIDGFPPQLEMSCWGGCRRFIMPRAPEGIWWSLLRVSGSAVVLSESTGVVWARRRTFGFYPEWWNTAVPSDTPGAGEELVAWTGTCSSKPHAGHCCHRRWGNIWATSGKCNCSGFYFFFILLKLTFHIYVLHYFKSFVGNVNNKCICGSFFHLTVNCLCCCYLGWQLTDTHYSPVMCLLSDICGKTFGCLKQRVKWKIIPDLLVLSISSCQVAWFVNVSLFLSKHNLSII